MTEATEPGSPMQKSTKTTGADQSGIRAIAAKETKLDHFGDGLFASLELLPSPIVLTDPNLPDNPVVFVNHAFSVLTGFESDAILGRNCRCLQGAETDRDTVNALREAVAGRRSIGVEIMNYKRDGAPFWNAVNISPIYDRQGKVAYCFASQADVTARRKADKALHAAQKLEALGQLTAGIAHDFNNLLQVATGSIDLLRGRLADETLTRYVDNADYAAKRATALTAQLLAFGRRTPLQPRTTDLNTFIEERRPILEAALGSYVTLRFRPGRGAPLTVIDSRQLEVALIQLLNNARDAMPRGGTVAVTVGPVTGAGGPRQSNIAHVDYVVLSVSDEGEGMSPAVLERAPEPFFTTRRFGRGSGLGLSMVHGFVKQSLGHLEIDSEPGYGTTVRMIFPTADRVTRFRAQNSGRTQNAGGRAGSAETPNADASRTAETILVVEDNDDVLVRASEHLDELGYRVVPVRSAEEALDVVRKADGAIDLLFTDIHMPGGANGVVLAKRIGKCWPDLPVLFASSPIGDLVDTEQDGRPAIDMIEKPYRGSELGRRVRAALRRKPAPASP
jgi:PAS domain S-box-containing protein